MSARTMRLYESAICSLLTVAHVFGIISPKSRMIRVSTPVTILTATLPQILIASVVASADAEILTILFPMSIVLSILLYFPRIFSTRAAFLLPSSTRVLRRILLTVVKADSAEEKNAESMISIIRTITCNRFAVFNIYAPFRTMSPRKMMVCHIDRSECTCQNARRKTLYITIALHMIKTT